MTADRVYDLHLPLRRSSVAIFASPHSGRDYPDELLAETTLGGLLLRSSEDAFIDRIYAGAPDHGAPLLTARAPRAWIDLNRAADELDPALIDGVARGMPNPRISSGLGVVPRVVANGRPIYGRKLSLAEARSRIDRSWQPYHTALRREIAITRELFGSAVVIDCHSMPHEAIESFGRTGRNVPEVVLGDRFGAAASADVTSAVEAAFLRAGFRVVRNTPFAGAYVTQAYGRPAAGQHVVQIEIDRALYMDEARVEPLPDFDAFCQRITGVVAEIAAIGAVGDLALAAE